jgi:hypothetical protein
MLTLTFGQRRGSVLLRCWAASAIALLVVLVADAGASAAAAKQRVGGFVVTWPDAVASGGTVPAGTALRVVVRPASAPSGRFARIEVRRLGDAGESVILRRRARRGSVVFQPAAGARYRVRVAVGRRSVQRTVGTSVAAAEPLPNPEPPPASCGATSPSASAALTPGSSTARAGETVSFALLNSGQECLRTSPLVVLRRHDGTDVPLNRPSPAMMRFVHPGETYVTALELPADLTPGLYRAVMFVQSGPEESPASQEVTAEFTVPA